MKFTVPMALCDFVPVLLFGASALILLKDLYNKLYKGAYALLASGTVNLFTAGFVKALHKLLYALGICNFEKLSALFLPVQALGFILAGLGMISLLKKKQWNGKIFGIAPLYVFLAATAADPQAKQEPPVYSGTLIFIIMMILGLMLMCISLSYCAVKMKKAAVVPLFWVTFVCCMSMGYLSSKDFAEAIYNWIGEGVNVVGQTALLVGVTILHRSGFGDTAND